MAKMAQPQHVVPSDLAFQHRRSTNMNLRPPLICCISAFQKTLLFSYVVPCLSPFPVVYLFVFDIALLVL